jgi:DNA-directed RNA polymerase subunit E'
MFKILKIKDTVRVPPTKFELELDEGIKKSLQEQIEGKIDSNLGVFLVVMEAKAVGEGQIKPEDGAIFYLAEYKVLTYLPELNEIVLGEVVDVTEFGAFTRIGPLDALVHVSQITDDKVSYDSKNAVFTTRKTKETLKEGDTVRARIVGVSLGKGRTKISLTMRQPCLGALSWIEKGKRSKKKDEKKEKK